MLERCGVFFCLLALGISAPLTGPSRHYTLIFEHGACLNIQHVSALFIDCVELPTDPLACPAGSKVDCLTFISGPSFYSILYLTLQALGFITLTAYIADTRVTAFNPVLDLPAR